jgi:nucleoside-diphosphate-sugar epimerase
MKILVIGSEGFVGRNVVAELSSNHEVYKAARSTASDDPHSVTVDLSSKESIRTALVSIHPDAVVNCAGIVMNTEEAYKNVEFTTNILDEVVNLGKPYPRVIVTGSASEYGEVEDAEVSVSEDAPLKPAGDYANSKVEEVKVAQSYSEKYGIDVVVARIFNPIGPGMGDKFLLTNLVKQIHALKEGVGHEITLSRLDSKRDYIDIRDVAAAIRLFIESDSKDHHVIQNIGSGKPTTNGHLLDMLLSHVELSEKPTIIETRTDPEPTYAARADLRRIKAEYNWEPRYNLSATIEDIYG